MTLNAAAMGWIALIAGPDLAYWQMVAPLIISGAGVAMVLPATQNAVLSSVGPQQIGKASGSYSTPRQRGAFRGRDIVAVFAGFGSYGSAETFSDGFAAALAACAALSLAGAGVAMLVPGVRSQRRRGRRENRRVGRLSGARVYVRTPADAACRRSFR